jgi:uncharacterized membrane protein YidH (DUF202 family)
MQSLFVQAFTFMAQIDLKPLPKPGAGAAELNRILTVVFVVAGSVALLVLVIGGYRYILSRGDPGATATAKNTIIYGVIGLIVVIVASSIVAFVLNLAKA